MAFTLKALSKCNVALKCKYFSNFTLGTLHSGPLFAPENFGSHLENCLSVDSLGKMHACLIIRGFEHNAFLGSKLIQSLTRFGLLTKSGHVFDNIINGSSISIWNSVMIGYFKGNHYIEVLGFYLKLRSRKVSVDNSSIVYGLKSCMEMGMYNFGTNLHSDGLKLGLNHDQFVCSSLIGFYSKFDQIKDACKVLDEMPDRDVVAYTSIITAYARLGEHYANDAFRVALEMQRQGFQPNRVTLVSLLQCVLQSGALKKGREIHGYAIRNGVGFGDKIFETSLMNMYIKLGDICNGCIVFDTVKAKSTASWNALISGLLYSGKAFEALNLFNRMAAENDDLDLISLANGLVIAVDLQHLLLGKAIHGYVLRNRVNLDVVGTTVLIDMYSKCRHLSGAVNVFNQTVHKDGVLFSVMLASYLDKGFVRKAMKTFQEMAALGISPSASTIIHMLSALSELKDVRVGKSVHGYAFRRGLEMNTDITNQLISMYSKCGLIQCSRVVFDMIKIKDRVSWTSIMTGYENHGDSYEAITLFRLMQREKISPDCITFTCLIQAASHLGFLSKAREVHAYLYRTHTFDVALTNSLITAYGKCGKLETARNLFDLMAERQLSTWNTMIAAYGMNGDCIKAMEFFNQMESTNLCPDEVTFKSLLSACSHAGFVQEGLEVFNSMEKRYGIVPSDEHYSCVVDMLGRAGWLKEAYEVVKRAPLRENGSSLRALLAACRVHGDSEMGERVGKWLLEVDPASTSAYCSVSNFYAGGGRWDAVAAIGAVTKEKGLRRTTGYSVVDVN